jgi:hypothetical protein
MSMFAQNDFGLVRVGRRREGVVLKHIKIRGER